MNDFETLEELREMYHYAKRDVADLNNAASEANNLVLRAEEVLRKAEERYLAHLEMMAAGVKQ